MKTFTDHRSGAALDSARSTIPFRNRETQRSIDAPVSGESTRDASSFSSRPLASYSGSGMPRILAKAKPGGFQGDRHDPVAVRESLGNGHALDSTTGSGMSRALGADFSSVRIHTDSHAADLSRSMNARAFTVGEDVAFGSGEYRPGTGSGDALIAHELAHVVQQRAGGGTGGEGNTAALEQDADKAATAATLAAYGARQGNGQSGASTSPSLAVGLSLQRCHDEPRSTTAAGSAPTAAGGAAAAAGGTAAAARGAAPVAPLWARVNFSGNHAFAGPGGAAKTNPTWTSASTDHGMAYTQGARPSVAAAMDIGMAVPATTLFVRAREGRRVLGMAEGVRVAGRIVSVPDFALSGLSRSFGVGKREYALTWDASVDGRSWTTVTTTGAHTIYWLLGRPTVPLVGRAVEKATGYVDALAPRAATPATVAPALREGIHREIIYNPSDSALDRNPLVLYDVGHGVCAAFGNLLTYLSQSVGMRGGVLMIWGGFEAYGKAIWVKDAATNNTIVNVKAADTDPSGVDFSYHVISRTTGGVHDAALNREGYNARAKFSGTRVELVDPIGGVMPNATVGIPYRARVSRGYYPVNLRTRTFDSPILGSDFGTTVRTLPLRFPAPALYHTPVRWGTSGLPAGLTITDDGVITGTPLVAGTARVLLRAAYQDIVGPVTSIVLKVNPRP